LFQWLRAHGDAALMIELGVLAVFCIGAMATDRYWIESDRQAKEFDVLARRD
jgi:hypothetical protein